MPYAEESPLQRIVLVERAGSLELFIDGELQFRSADERLYHDGLLAPALERLHTRARVLVQRSIALYSAAFYGAMRARLAPRGVVVTHASSLDTWAEQAVPEALAAAGFTTSVYARSVPSFESVTYVIGT